MNFEYISPQEDKSGLTFGLINVIGGEKFEILPKDEEIILGDDKAFSFIRKMSNKDLKSLAEKIEDKIGGEMVSVPKRTKTIYKLVKPSKEEIVSLRKKKKAIIELINSRKRSFYKPRRIDSETVYGNFSIDFTPKTSCQLKSSMIRSTITYEIVNGDKMKKNEIHIKERVDEETGELVYDMYKECNLPYTKHGELKTVDKIVLHNSGKLAVPVENSKGEKTYVPTNRFLNENQILEFLYLSDEVHVMIPNTSSFDPGTPIENVRRLGLNIDNDAKNGLARRYLTDLRGSKFGFSEVKIWNPSGHRKETLPMLSFNNINYESNNIVIVGTKLVCKGVLKQLEEKNQKKIWHNFSGQDLMEYDPKYLGRAPEKRRTKEGVVGLNGLDHELKKYLRRFSEEPTPITTSDEVTELLLIADDQDGRQTLVNLEHDLRVELRDYKTRTSTELYVLIKELEDEIFRRKMPKKHQALINVLKSFKSSKDLEEETGKGLSSDLKDLVTKEKEGFKAGKKNKNLYNQQRGVLDRNQNPQDMEPLTRVDMKEIRQLRKENSKEIFSKDMEDARHYFYKIVKDGRGNDIKVFNLELTQYAGFCQRGGKPISPPSPSKVNGINIPENEYHHEDKKDYSKVSKVHCVGSISWNRDEDARTRIEYMEKENGTYKKQVPAERKYYPGRLMLERFSLFFKQFEEETDEEKIERMNMSLGSSKQNSISKFRKEKVKGGIRGLFPLTSSFKRTSIPKDGIWWIGEGKGVPQYKIVGKENGYNKVILKKFPHVELYAKGNLDILNRYLILSVTGTRHPSRETKDFLKKKVDEFCKEGYVIASGLAEGCDTIAHKGALKNNAPTIAVLPCGFNNIFPKENKELADEIVKQGGLLLSEYKPSKGAFCNSEHCTFKRRNKVLVGLSKKVLVCEAGRGTMNTYNWANLMDKEIIRQPTKRGLLPL